MLKSGLDSESPFALVSIVIERWRLVLLCIILSVAACSIYLRNTTYTYSIDLRVSPAQSDSSGALGKLGGLAAVAGINLPTDRAVSPFELYVEALYLPEVSQELSKNNALMRGAFYKEWNQKENRFVKPTGIVGSLVNGVKGLLGIPNYKWQPPNGQRLNKFIRDEINVSRDAKKSIATIHMDHKDPQFASMFLLELHSTVDRMLRVRAQRRADSNIDYLSKKLREVVLAEHREALASTLSEQERQRMMTAGTASYAADLFGGPSISMRPTKPKPTLMLGLAFALGLLGGAALAIGKTSVQSGSNASALQSAISL